MSARRFGVLALLLATSGCERAGETVTSERLPEPIRVAPPRVEPPKPAVSMPAPVAVPRPINPRELPPPQPRRKRATWFSQLSTDERTAVRGICEIKKSDPCAGMMPKRINRDGGPVQQDPIEGLYAKLENPDFEKVDRFCKVNYKVEICDTPLVIAFDSQPTIALAPATAAAFAFRPGSPASTEWPTPSTPWLALDRDGNGSIDSGAELFGDSTVLPDGTEAAHGFAALEALDANHDGVIDRRDPMFAALLLWSDRDGDRASSRDELSPAGAIVESISLAFDGGAQGPRAAITWRDSGGAMRTGAVVDLYLRSR